MANLGGETGLWERSVGKLLGEQLWRHRAGRAAKCLAYGKVPSLARTGLLETWGRCLASQAW